MRSKSEKKNNVPFSFSYGRKLFGEKCNFLYETEVTREKRNICFPGQESNSGNKTHSKPNTAAFSKPNSGHKKDISPFLVTKQQQQRCHLEKKTFPGRNSLGKKDVVIKLFVSSSAVEFIGLVTNKSRS